MTVVGVSHVAIGVADMDAVLPFYIDVFGFRITSDFTQEIRPDQGPELHKGRHIRRRQVWLRCGDGPTAMAIALDQMFEGGSADTRSDIYDRGIHHVGLWVSDIRAVYERAQDGGYTVLMPHTAPIDAYGDDADRDERIASCFFKDPEGNIIQADQRIGPGEMSDWRVGGSGKVEV